MLCVGLLLAILAVLAADWVGARIGAAILNGVRLRMFEHLQRLYAWATGCEQDREP